MLILAVLHSRFWSGQQQFHGRVSFSWSGWIAHFLREGITQFFQSGLSIIERYYHLARPNISSNHSLLFQILVMNLVHRKVIASTLAANEFASMQDTMQCYISIGFSIHRSLKLMERIQSLVVGCLFSRPCRCILNPQVLIMNFQKIWF